MLQVCLPGTGSVLPLPNRWLPCCWLEHQGTALLIDCGEGTQLALKVAGCRLKRLELLLITHFHADHTSGLPGLLLTLGNSGKQSPLYIAGPPGIAEVVQALRTIAPVLPYPVEILPLEGGQSFQHGAFEIATLELAHGIPCLGYSLTIRRKPVFNPQKAGALPIPKEYYKRLHAGEAFTLPDGQSIAPEQVLDAPRAPLKVCYCTDTAPIPAIATFAQGASLFICEGMDADPEKQHRLHEKGHMLFWESAQLAKQAQARALWLTHFSPALPYPQQHIAGAQAIFPQAQAGYDGIRTTLR